MTRRSASRKVSRPWTKDEIAFMRKYYRKYETAWIARQLGRTVYSVRYKAVDLNLKKANPSVWKGNVGSANAFRKSFNRMSTTRKTRRVSGRSKKSTRSYRASSIRRTGRKSTSRRNRRR
jgi:hypothetical protein